MGLQSIYLIPVKSCNNRAFHSNPEGEPDLRKNPGFVRRLTHRRESCRWTVWIALIFAICAISRECLVFAAEQRTGSSIRTAQKDEVPKEKEITRMQDSIVRLTNKQRAREGLQPLDISAALIFLARNQTRNMCAHDILAHESDLFPEGWRKLSERMEAVRIRSAGENIAYGTMIKDPEKWADLIVKDWMKSPEHRKNILNPKFRYLGVAVSACSGNLAYATQVFSSERGSTRAR